MKKKTKKYFVGGLIDAGTAALTKKMGIPQGSASAVGGLVNSGLSGLGGSFGLDATSSQLLGGAGQAATGLISGNPMDVMQGAGSLAKTGLSLIGGNKAEDKADTNEFNSLIKNQMKNGGDLMEFGGFTHDDNSPENVNEGNLIKSGQDGDHVVEKDETYKDGKVYSNNKGMPVPDGKYKGKTFAQASKLINKIADERPDKMFTKYRDDSLKSLFDTQESIKQDYEAHEEMKMRCGGKMYYKGGKINEGDFDVDDISDDEIQYLNSLGYNIEVED